jgi:hypothetical protein
VAALRVEFAAIFSHDCLFDTAFVTGEQESQIKLLCAAFYVAV